MLGMYVRSLGIRKIPLEEEMATLSSILAWEIPWTKEPGELKSMGSQRVRHNLATKHQTYHLTVLLSPGPPSRAFTENLVVPKPIDPPRLLGGLTERVSGLLPKIWIQ